MTDPRKRQKADPGLDPSKPLKNARREHYCQLVASGMPSVDAYEAAGYSKANRESSRTNSGQLNVTPEVRNRIDWLLQQKADAFVKSSKSAAEEVGIDKKWVLQRLVDIHNFAITGEPIVNAEGMQLGTKQNLPAANKAVELIGREIGMFSERLKVGGDPDSPPIKTQNEDVSVIALERLRETMQKRIEKQHG